MICVSVRDTKLVNSIFAALISRFSGYLAARGDGLDHIMMIKVNPRFVECEVDS